MNVTCRRISDRRNRLSRREMASRQCTARPGAEVRKSSVRAELVSSRRTKLARAAVAHTGENGNRVEHRHEPAYSVIRNSVPPAARSGPSFQPMSRRSATGPPHKLARHPPERNDRAASTARSSRRPTHRVLRAAIAVFIRRRAAKSTRRGIRAVPLCVDTRGPWRRDDELEIPRIEDAHPRHVAKQR